MQTTIKKTKVVNHKGIALMIIGLALIIAAAGLVWYNRMEDARAEAESELVLTRLEAATADSARGLMDVETEMPVVQIDGRDYVGRLTIDAVEMDLPILAYWDDDDAKIAPCRYFGSVYDDSMVICGHNMHAHFNALNRLQTGDAVTFTDVNGNVFSYLVSSVTTLHASEVGTMVSGSDWDLTLFTCTYDGESRVTIRCSRRYLAGDDLTPE